MTAPELVRCLNRMPGRLLVAEPNTADLADELGRITGREVVVVDQLRGTPGTAAGMAIEAAGVDDVALVMHTSGTTGDPKRVDARQGPLLTRGLLNCSLMGLRPESRFVTAALFHHVGGLGNIAVALTAGSTLVMLPSFSVEAWRALAAVAPTHTVMVPSVIEMLLDAGALDLSSLEIIAYGASPIRPETMQRVQEAVPAAGFVNLFGQTEGSPIAVLTPDDHRLAASERPELLASVGRAAPGVTLRLDQPDDQGVGELWALMSHSFVVDADGWQHTGDLARIDAEGYVYLVGRRGDKIIRGGENVFPVEVEQALEAHDGVREAAVIGVPDRRLGETIKAFVVLADAHRPVDVEELRVHVRSRLSGFKVPTQWEFIADLPRTTTGKVTRRVLAERENQQAEPGVS